MPPPTLHIRRATPDDAPALIAYLIAITDEPHNNVVRDPGQWTLSVDDERDFLARAAADPDRLFLVAELAGQIVACANIAREPQLTARHAATLGITVAAPFRRQGIGRAMILAMLDWARDHGLRRVELQVFTRNPGAIALYESLGFVKEGLHRMAFYKQGVWVDEFTMALLLPEQEPRPPAFPAPTC